MAMNQICFKITYTYSEYATNEIASKVLEDKQHLIIHHCEIFVTVGTLNHYNTIIRVTWSQSWSSAVTGRRGARDGLKVA